MAAGLSREMWVIINQKLPSLIRCNFANCSTFYQQHGMAEIYLYKKLKYLDLTFYHLNFSTSISLSVRISNAHFQAMKDIPLHLFINVLLNKYFNIHCVY